MKMKYFESTKCNELTDDAKVILRDYGHGKHLSDKEIDKCIKDLTQSDYDTGRAYNALDTLALNPFTESVDTDLDGLTDKIDDMLNELDEELTEADAKDVGLNKSNYTIDAKNVNELSHINPVDFRLKYAKNIVDKLISGFANASWGEVKESDPNYSGFTTTTVVGDKAIELASMMLDAVKQGKMRSDDESEGDEKITRFSIPNLPDAQIFYDEGSDGSMDDVLTLVVRPIEVDQEVTIRV